LTVSVRGPSANEVTVTIDDKSVPSALLGVERFTDPGKHRIVAKYGSEVETETVVLAEGEAKQLVLKFHGSTPEVANANHTNPTPARDGSESTTRVGDSHTDPTQDRAGHTGKAQRTWGYVGLGVGAAALAFGGVTGLIVASKYSDLNSKCSDRKNCAYPDEVHSYQTFQTLSTVGFIVGGVAAATGVTLILTAPKDKPGTTVSLWLSGNSLAMKGQF
jgi:hypothetical protein